MNVIHRKQTSLAEESRQPEKFMFFHISSPESAWKVRVQVGRPLTPHRQAGNTSVRAPDSAVKGLIWS